jgi:hypothetical protein
MYKSPPLAIYLLKLESELHCNAIATEFETIFLHSQNDGALKQVFLFIFFYFWIVNHDEGK